jgi:putative transcriptional regulator
MKKHTTTRFELDPDHLPRLTRGQQARLDAMTQEEVEAAARSDPDAQPVQAGQLPAFQRVPDLKAVRRHLGLTQKQFAAAFQLSLATVRDWEQRRYAPDQAARTLLRVIAREPDAVRRALAS